MKKRKKATEGIQVTTIFAFGFTNNLRYRKIRTNRASYPKNEIYLPSGASETQTEPKRKNGRRVEFPVDTKAPAGAAREDPEELERRSI